MGVPVGGWVYKTCTAACCRIVNDATDAELRASGCWVCTVVILLRVLLVIQLSRLALQNLYLET